jgi:anti-sigma B factor antagonist
MAPSAHHLQIEPSTDESGRRVLALSGDIDLLTVPRLTEQVLAAESDVDTIVLDLTNVRFLDSPGLGAIIHCNLHLAEAGVGLVLRSPQPQVQELFELVQLGSFVTVEHAG